MSTAMLPLEIQQQIYSLLDARSFHSVRQVCRWWRYASYNSSLLSEKLLGLPMWPADVQRTTQPHALHRLFDQAAHRLMFGVRISQEDETPRDPFLPIKLHVRPVTATSSNGSKMAILNNGVVTLCDISKPTPTALSQRHLQDVRELPVGCPGFKASRSSQYQLALSSNGGHLAVALGQTVQIYNLSDHGHEPVTRHITDTQHRSITNLHFEDNDHLLRISLNGGDSVVYLGSPSDDTATIATSSHWSSDSGLKHVFVDSSRLVVSNGPGANARCSGLQLLRPLRGGYIFCAQLHSEGRSSRYSLGYVRCLQNPYLSTQTIDHTNVFELAHFETFLSSQDYDTSALRDSGMGVWENMPSALEHHPHYALMDGFLVVTERHKRYARAMPQFTQVFLYRAPGEQVMLRLLEQRGNCGSDEKVEAPKWPQSSVARLPLSLGSVAGDVRDIQLTRPSFTGAAVHDIKVSTEETTKVWRIADL